MGSGQSGNVASAVFKSASRKRGCALLVPIGLMLAGLMLAGCAAGAAGPAGPPGDFGDAPEGSATGYPVLFAQTGQFPTLAASGGAHTQSVNGGRLGADASAESDANDPADPDGVANLAPSNTDSDDGPLGLVIQMVSIPPPAFLDLSLTVPAGGQSGTYWLNVLIDLDMDGNWGGTVPPGNPEWVVKNIPVALTAGQALAYRTPYFAYGAGNRVPDPAWMRVALTSEAVTDTDWTGTGTFAAGEIEDHLLRFPDVNGKPEPVVNMDCGAPVKRFPAGAAQLRFRCVITNVRNVAGTVDYWFTRRSGGVDLSLVAPVPVPGVPQGPGAAIAESATLVGNDRLILNMVANRGAMRSQWRYDASANDPLSSTDSKGILVGYTDSSGMVTFVAEEEVERQQQMPAQDRPREDMK